MAGRLRDTLSRRYRNRRPQHEQTRSARARGGAAEPLLSTTPPLSFELDTLLMEDGPHTMRIEAYDDLGVRGTRTIDFSVRNGPGATRPRSCGSQTSLDCVSNE